jgi:hypothetical protein
VIPAISHQQLLGFDLSLVLSPKTDPLNILGKHLDLPSNISVPQQSESYIFPISLNKPTYRVYVREPGQYEMLAMHGKFPFVPVVDDIRSGKSMFDLINRFSFSGGSQKTLDVQNGVDGNDMSMNQIAFDKQVKVTAPAIADDQVMVSLAILEQNGKMMPTDLKRLTAGQSLNLTATGDAPSVLSVLLHDSNASSVANFIRRAFAPLDLLDAYFEANGLHPQVTQDFSQLSFALLPAAGGVAPTFLPLIDKPSLSGQSLKMDPPLLPSGLVAAGSYMAFSEIESIVNGKLHTERRTRLWQVVSQSWDAQVDLPNLNFVANPDRKYRWEVMFLARPANFSGSPTPADILDLSGVTHVTRNSLDL